MASVTTTFVFLMFILFIAIAEGEKKKEINKIIIHVPYKIHKHHHTHTKYKVVTVPAPKKENTIIYLKEEIQPTGKQVPIQTQTKLTETQAKTPEPFIPPHQQSAAALLDSLANHKEESVMPVDHQQHYSTIVDDQKPLESYSDQNSEHLLPNFIYKPVLLSSHENLIPNFSQKSGALPEQNVFLPNLLLHQVMHQPYKPSLPKFTNQLMFHLPPTQFNTKYIFKPMLPIPKLLHDSIYTGSQIHKTVLPIQPRATSYKVKEENHEDHTAQIIKNQHTTLNKVPIFPIKAARKGKKSSLPGPNHVLKSTENMFPTNPDYEYEHVGYLIIEGNSRKVVGKNFKDEIYLFR